jgi:hypothetical protein
LKRRGRRRKGHVFRWFLRRFRVARVFAQMGMDCDFRIRVRSNVSHNATLAGRGLSSGTSPERNAPESLTPLHSGFVHRNISRWPAIAALDQVRQRPTSRALTPIPLTRAGPRSRIRRGKESTGFDALFITASSSRSHLVIPGWCVSTRPQLRNCASGNPWIPGSLRAPE